MSLACIFVITPLIAVAVTELIEMPRAPRIAIAALSFSIIPPMLPRKQLAAGGDRSYGNALTVTTAACAIVLVPLLVDLVGDLIGRSYGVPPGEIAAYVVTILGLPLLLGALFRLARPDTARSISRPLTRVAATLSTVALAFALLRSGAELWGLLELGTLLGIAAFTIAALAAGHLLAGTRSDREVTLALSSATRHPAIALTIASANYPEDRIAAAVTLCLIVNAIVCFPYVRWQRRRLRPTA